MYLMKPVDEKLEITQKEWLVVYDPWQPEDFDILNKYGLDPKAYKMSNVYKEYQRVIRRCDGQVFHLYF